jgi:hypothetical protein
VGPKTQSRFSFFINFLIHLDCLNLTLQKKTADISRTSVLDPDPHKNRRLDPEPQKNADPDQYFFIFLQ